MYCEIGLGEKMSAEDVKWCFQKKSSSMHQWVTDT